MLEAILSGQARLGVGHGAVTLGQARLSIGHRAVTLGELELIAGHCRAADPCRSGGQESSGNTCKENGLHGFIPVVQPERAVEVLYGGFAMPDAPRRYRRVIKLCVLTNVIR